MNKIDIRVSYADTDQMGMVYYGNYLTYFERGRTEWLREYGIAYKDIEANELYFPVMNATCNYHSPAKYDDMITVETKLAELGAAYLVFSYEVKLGERLLVSGSTKHPLVNGSFKPVRFPKEMRELLEKHIENGKVESAK